MDATQYDFMRLRRTLLVMALSLTVAGLAMLGWEFWNAQPVQAVGPYLVNSTNDDADATISDGLCRTAKGECTLRAAIEQANADGGATTINITATGTITLSSNLPSINTNLTIAGPGAAQLAIHGANSYRPFYISSGKTVVISGLTLTHGNSSGGGAVSINFGTLTLNACTVSYNTSTGSGGGIYNYGGVLIIKASTISGNMAYYNGGGLYDSIGNLTIETSAISGNMAYYNGGGLSTSSTGLTMKASIISRNVTSNTTGSGGGLYLGYSDADLTNNVVADNRSGGPGSGIYISGAAPRLKHTTIARNTGGDGSGVYVTSYSTPILTNTILVSQQVGITVTGGSTATLSAVLGFNNGLNSGGSGGTIVAKSYVGNPAFAADGYHLTASSLALNKGVEAGIATDIDGEPRDAAPDLGAVEYRTCWARLNNNLTDYGHAQAAVDASTRITDVVKLAGYCPGVVTSAGLSQAVYVSKTVTIRGGYTPANWITPNPAANRTTLDALKQGRVFYITGNINPTIEGLRIIGGNAVGLAGGLYGSSGGGGVYAITATAILSNTNVASNTAYYGGGVYLSGSTTTLNRNTIIGNTAGGSTAYGGGLYLSNSPAILDGNVISGNTASGVDYSYGGGLRLEYSAAVLRGNSIIGNSAAGATYGNYCGGASLYYSPASLDGNIISANNGGAEGGGLCLSSSPATLRGNIITSNTADSGGGVYLYFSSADLINTVVADNRGSIGSGIYVDSSPAPRLRQTTITRNPGGDGIYVGGITSTVALTNTILVSQTRGITVTGTNNRAILNGVLWHNNGANTGGGGVITVTQAYTGNPAFASDGYHLTVGSMAIDRGLNAGITTDIDGDPRVAAPDLGADEYQSGPGESRIRVYPILGGLLIYTDTRGLTTTVQFMPGTVTDTTDIVYTAVPSLTEPISPGLHLAGFAFDLSAYRNGVPVLSITFSKTVTVTIHYADADLVGIDENTLRLYRWVSLWEIVGTRSGEGQSLDAVHNTLTAWLRGLSKFGSMGASPNNYDLFLPIVVKGE